jgi:type I restriction enzyme S subunit
MNFILCKEASFKKTPIGKIPKDWELAKLSDIAEDIYYGITAKAVENNTGLKMLRTTDIKDYTVDWDSLPFCELTEKRGDIQRFLLKQEDLIIARAGTTGVSVLVEKDFENVVFGSYLIKVRLNRKVLPKFMRYFCQSHLYWDHITSSQAGSTLKNISLPVLKSLNIPLPSSIEEQQNIAEVLSMVDEAIRKTNEIIGKTERLKKGLMQELLTKGIGHKEFKDTEIGRIPKDWRIVELGETVEINKESIDPIKEIPNKTFIYIDIDSIESGTGKIRNPKRILGRDAPSRARRVIHEDDVIMSTVRPYLKAFAIVPKEYDNQICSTGFAVLTCKNLILPYFLLNVLFSDSVIAQCNRMMVGGQYPALNQSQVSRIKIPLPPLLEQQRITEILSAIDQKLEIERKEKTKLERIKQGLMDLLLTGKIRVKVGQ